MSFRSTPTYIRNFAVTRSDVLPAHEKQKPRLGHAVKTSAPLGGELESALLAPLRKNHFSAPEHVSVFLVGLEVAPICILTMGPDVAKVLADLLAPLLGKRAQASSTEWVLFRSDAEKILMEMP